MGRGVIVAKMGRGVLRWVGTADFGKGPQVRIRVVLRGSLALWWRRECESRQLVEVTDCLLTDCEANRIEHANVPSIKSC